jgi:ABC-type lipoprotein release transport system permease subunit
VFPLLSSYPGSDKGGLGTGAWIAPGAGTANADQGGGGSGVGPQQVWLSLAPGTDQKALAARLTKTTGQDQVVIQDVPRASIVRALGDLDRTPLYLAFLICFLVGATVIHALTAAVWRRRRDIALLQTLGFTRGQVRRSVLVQATVIGLVALVVGLPLGIIVGRWAWSILSDTLGTVAGLTVPWAALALVVAVVLVLVNAVGLIPATRVLHRTPAQTLRSE